MTLRDALPPDQRPRERMLRLGPSALTNSELLALMLGTGTRGQNALVLAQNLLNHFGGVRSLLSAQFIDLKGFHGLGKAKICQLTAILALGRRALEEELRRECTLHVPDQVKAYCAALLGHETIEYCIALFLDNQHRLICAEEISRGTLTQTSIYPREVVKAGLARHAAAIILAHNHPSGNLQPSEADIQLTRKLREAGLMLDLPVLDHLIISSEGYYSFADEGLL